MVCICISGGAMKRDSIVTGLLIVFVIGCLVAGALANWHTREPHLSAMGAFHCDPDGRLPCDGVR